MTSNAKVVSITESATALASRLGIFTTTTPPHAGPDAKKIDDSQVYSTIIEALNKDPRVKKLEAVAADEAELSQTHFAWSGSPRKRRRDGGRKNTDPGTPHRHYHALTFSPIALEIEVPRRLQRSSWSDDHVPAERYWIAWDGIGVFVAWEIDQSPYPFDSSGGLIALDVLADAAKKAGLGVRSQPCGPTCNYPFAHEDLMILPTTDTDEIKMSEAGELTRVVVPVPDDRLELVLRIHRECSFLVTLFARMRGHGAAIVNAEREARQTLGELLRLQYEKYDIATMPLLLSLKRRWKSRGRRRKMDVLTANLWIRLATIEENRREWSVARFVYESNAPLRGFDRMFKREYPQEVDAIQSLEVSELRSAVDRLSNGIDTRMVALATVGGALLGSLVGAILTTIIGLLTT